MTDDARPMREFKMDMVIANPDPLGLFGFAFATFLGNAATLGLYGNTSGQLIFECMFLGGFLQLIAGLQDYKNRNLFGATAFTGFGFFWIVFGVVSWLSYVHLVGPADGATVGWYHLLWAVFVFALVGTSFALTKFLTATVIFVDAGLVLIAVGAFGSIDAATKLGAASLVISALLALYIGLAQMWNLTFGRTVLPLYPWKSVERPHTAWHDPVTHDSPTLSDRGRAAVAVLAGPTGRTWRDDRAMSRPIGADLEGRATITGSLDDPTDLGESIEDAPEAHARQDMDHVGTDWDLTRPRHGEHAD